MTVKPKSWANRMAQQTKPKRCRKCGRFKPLRAYHRDSTKPDGRMQACAGCRNDYHQHRRDSTPTPADWQAEFDYLDVIRHLPAADVYAIELAARLWAGLPPPAEPPDWWDAPESAWDVQLQAGIHEKPYGWIVTLGAYYYGAPPTRNRHIRSQGQRKAVA